jgi:hypothetical protein
LRLTAAPFRLSAQRDPVLKQIQVPHSYYYREMYLPQVTSGPSSAAWSPDGKELVYSMQGSLWRQRLGSGEAIQLTDGPGYDYQPDWSPDGRWVVYSSYRNDAMELWALDLTDGSTQALVANGAVNLDPRWSPDGGRIAFVSTAHEGRFHVFLCAFAPLRLSAAPLRPSAAPLRLCAFAPPASSKELRIPPLEFGFSRFGIGALDPAAARRRVGVPSLRPRLKNQHAAGGATHPLPYDLPHRKFLGVDDHAAGVEPRQQRPLRRPPLQGNLCEQRLESQGQRLQDHSPAQIGVRVQKGLEIFPPVQVLQQRADRNPRLREYRRSIPDLGGPHHHLK